MNTCTARASALLRGVAGLVGSDTVRRVGEVSPRKIGEVIEGGSPRSSWDTFVVNLAVKVQSGVRSAERISAEAFKAFKSGAEEGRRSEFSR